jgi:hypothetical protein
MSFDYPAGDRGRDSFHLGDDIGNLLRTVACAASSTARRCSRLLSLALQPIDFLLKLRDPLELHVEVAAYLIDDRATFVQEIDDVVEFGPRDRNPSRLRDTR